MNVMTKFMPGDRKKWYSDIHISNFVNTYYQYRDLQSFKECEKILIVGPGQGVDANFLKWKKYKITTIDIDDTFKPDIIGSVHDLNMIADNEFDVVIASHVLEHLPIQYLDKALYEISRVSKHAIIYLPVHGVPFHLRFRLGVTIFEFSVLFNLFNYFKKTDGTKPKYMSGQHYWEVGVRGFRLKDVSTRISKFFKIVLVYRNKDWVSSQNFLLTSLLRSS